MKKVKTVKNSKKKTASIKKKNTKKIKDDLTTNKISSHLLDLRGCIVKIIISIFIVSMVNFFLVIDLILEFIKKPAVPYITSLIFTAPMDKFFSYLKLSLTAGIIIAAPYCFYQVWNFVKPGLYQKEKKYAILFSFVSSTLLILGVIFAYILVLPNAFKFFITFGGEAAVPLITISAYIDFFTKIILAFAFAFQLPLVLVFLSLIGVINHQILRKIRPYSYLGLSIISAILSPPDLLSMIFLLIPLILLYESSIFFCILTKKKKLP